MYDDGTNADGVVLLEFCVCTTAGVMVVVSCFSFLFVLIVGTVSVVFRTC